MPLASLNQAAPPKRGNASRLFGYDLFISFALGPAPRGTHSYASDLARRLRERDFTVFFSEDEAAPGDQLDSTLRRALHRSKALIVIANRGTLGDPRWVRTEVEEFTSRHPRRPAILINVGGALQDPALTDAQHWLAFQNKIWLDESEDAVLTGIASDVVVDRLATAPTRSRANVRWRWLRRAVAAILLGLTGIASWSAWFAAGQSRLAEQRQHEAEYQRDAAKQAAEAEGRARVAETAQRQIAEENERREARARQDAESRQYAARALLAAESDPATALQLAVKAGELGDNLDADTALRRAINRSHLQVVLSGAGRVSAVEMTRDDIVTVGQDGQIRMWNAASGRLAAEIPSGMRGGLRGLALSPNSTRAVVWGGFDDVGLWDLGSRRELRHLKTFDQVRLAGFSADGTTMFAVHGATVSLHRAVDGADIGRVSGTVVRNAVIGPDGRLLAAGSEDGRRVELWDTQSLSKSLGSLSTSGPVQRTAISGDGKWLAAISDAPAPAPGFKLWSLDASRRAVAYDRLGMDALDVMMVSAQFFNSAQRPRQPLGLITGSSDGVVRAWTKGDGPDWQLLSSLRGHSGPVRDLAISPDMNKMASAGNDGTVRVWIRDPGDVMSTPSWHPYSIARGHRGRVSKVRFTADGRRLVTIGEDGTAMLWNTEPDTEIATAMPRFSRGYLDVGPPNVELIRNGSAARFSPAGVTLLEKGLDSFCGSVLAVVSKPLTSPDGLRRVTGDLDGTVRVVDTSTGALLSEIRDHRCHVTAIAFSRDGKVFATSSGDGTVRLYAVHVPDLVALARSRFPATR